MRLSITGNWSSKWETKLKRSFARKYPEYAYSLRFTQQILNTGEKAQKTLIRYIYIRIQTYYIQEDPTLWKLKSFILKQKAYVVNTIKTPEFNNILKNFLTLLAVFHSSGNNPFFTKTNKPKKKNKTKRTTTSNYILCCDSWTWHSINTYPSIHLFLNALSYL